MLSLTLIIPALQTYTSEQKREEAYKEDRGGRNKRYEIDLQESDEVSSTSVCDRRVHFNPSPTRI